MREESDWQELFGELDIEHYLETEGVRYRRTFGAKGTQLNMRECPVCGGKGWKVYINAETGLGNCFHGSCGQTFNKGSLVRALMSSEGSEVSWFEVRKQIEQFLARNGWRPKRKPSKEKLSNGRVSLPANVSIPYKENNLPYLKARGISSSVAKAFDLRFCAKGYYSYSFDGMTIRQDYSNRVLIPVYDLEGVMVNFQGRDITGAANEKYLFPPGLAGTGRFLYNGHRARGARTLLVGEGAFDTIALEMAIAGQQDFRSVAAVGTFGKHLSGVLNPDAEFKLPDDQCQVSELIKLKAEGLEELVFMWDGERKARNDAVKAGLFLRRLGFKCRLGVLPDDKDPNEVAPEVIREAYWRAEQIDPIRVAKWKAAKLI
ncbi:hypothetical protein [Chitinibacter tainanensis]|uniref:hypothetical protein n=1 Tax=Chitinibacter tainanensis TaxID=230667 RepID=UPI00040EF78C|nr:hypothetical protein [Chitinibacter tainanensis]